MKPYRIPTFLGLIAIALGTGVGVLLVQNQKTYQSSASSEGNPSQVKITNIRDKSFTVSWTTDKPVSGFVAYGPSKNLSATIGQKTPSLLHHITVENLSPQTKYYFNIGSGKNIFDNNGIPYEVKTAPILKQTSKPDVIFGSIKLSANKPASNVIVYINMPGTSPLSAQTDSQGRWSVPLSTARSNSLVSFATYDKEKTPVDIYVQGENGRFANARATTKLSRPLPTITIGQTYDFSSSLTGPIETNINPQKEDQMPNSQLNLQ